jgi:hypothetical protein
MPLVGTIYATNETRADDGYLFVLDTDVACEVERAMTAALKATNPRAVRQMAGASVAFDERWNDVACALRETAFALGVEYGRRLGGAK